MKRLMVPLVLTVLASCSQGSGGDDTEPGEARMGSEGVEGVELPGPGTLRPLSAPAAWQGDLPCADCAGIRTILVLDPDGSYRQEHGYLGLAPEADTLFGEMGRWVLEGDRHRISLHGSGEGTGWYSVRKDGSLRMLDREGREIESALPYSLSPLSGVPELKAPLRMTGAFTYMADAALFVELQERDPAPRGHDGGIPPP